MKSVQQSFSNLVCSFYLDGTKEFSQSVSQKAISILPNSNWICPLPTSMPGSQNVKQEGPMYV